MYIGNTPTSSTFVSLTERFNGDNTTTAFTLSRTVYATGDIEVIVNNVQQDPFTAYTVSGTTLTFTGAPSTGTGNIVVTYRNNIVTKIVPSEGTVGTAALTTTGVSSGSYGGATQIPVVTVGTDGRISYAANVALSTVPTYSSGPFAVGNTSGAIANTSLDVYGGVAMNVVTLATSSNTINVALANYFIVNPAGTTTFVFTGAPVARDSSFVVELANGGAYTITFPSSVKWPSNTAPTLTSSGKDLLIFSTANTGTTWRGSSLIGYTA